MGRAWGLGGGLAVAGALAGVALVAGDVYVELPLVENRTTVLHALPVLTATALGYPMVDRWPDLSLVAGRPPARLFALRLLAVVVLSVPVLLALVAAGWTVPAATVVLAATGVAALLVAVLGLWYWVPMFGVLVAWVQLRPSYLLEGRGAVVLAGTMLVLAAGGAAYVAIGAGRVRRAVRATGAESEVGADLATMRP